MRLGERLCPECNITLKHFRALGVDMQMRYLNIEWYHYYNEDEALNSNMYNMYELILNN